MNHTVNTSPGSCRVCVLQALHLGTVLYCFTYCSVYNCTVSLPVYSTVLLTTVLPGWHFVQYPYQLRLAQLLATRVLAKMGSISMFHAKCGGRGQGLS